jgi:membrane associated rhomboid family serine protease
MAAAGSFGKRGVSRPAALAQPAMISRPVPAPAFHRAPATSLPEVPTAAMPLLLARIPFATLIITVILVVLFLFEAKEAVDAGPGLALSHRELVQMGGLSRDLAAQGQWWRLFTAPLLHGSVGHIAGNVTVLLLVGWLLEPLIGSAWFAALFFVGALGGACASMLMNPAQVVTVGASGAIMALLSSTFVCSFHDEAGSVAKRMRYLSLRLILPSLLPSLAGAASHTDFSAHTGGALAGVAMGFAMMILWPENAPRPAFKSLAWSVAGIGAVLAAVSFALAMQVSPVMAARDVGLIPQNEMPHDTPDGIAASADLVTRYPRDPRGHLFRAMHFLEIRDASDAGDQLRTALAGMDAVRDEVSEKVEPSIRIMLALTLVAQGRQPEAVTVATPACAFAAGEPAFKDALDAHVNVT